MTWQIEGGSADLPSSVQSLFKTFLTDNWGTTTPTENDIKFANDWWDDNGDYQVHVRPFRTDVAPAVIGSTRYEYTDLLQIHVFVRGNSEDEPSYVDNIRREIDRICGLNPTGMSASNIRQVGMPQWVVLTERDNTTTLWHLVGTVMVKYQKVKA